MFFALGIVPLTFVLGVVATDVTIWQSERRGAQKDADLAALAGAKELLETTQVAANAIAKANEYADTNDEAGNAQVIGAPVVNNSCFGGPRLDAVTVDIDHDSRTFFADFFGISVPEVGAHAKACAGTVIRRRGLRPYAIEVTNDSCFSNGLPVYGLPGCVLDDGSLSTSTASRGLIDLNNAGVCSDRNGNLIRDQVANGAQSACEVGDSINTQTGGQPGRDLEGIQLLLEGSGTPAVRDGAQCDKLVPGISNNNGEDDFDEVLAEASAGPPILYALRGCTSPRIIDIVIIDQFGAQPSRPADMLGIASIYILGCKQPAEPYSIITSDDAHKTCWAFDKPNTPGQVELWGIFFPKLDTLGDLGEYDPLGPRGIRLHE